MAATDYIRSYSTDFSSLVKSVQFQEEINNSIDIAPSCVYVNLNGDVVTIRMDDVLTAGEETALNAIISAHVPSTVVNGLLYDAIVDASGQEGYLLPSAAFAAGHKSLFVRNGVYFETSDLIVPNYGAICGESGVNTVIHFSNTASSVVCDSGVSPREYVGTITVTNGSAVVTGSGGTTFTNLNVGNYILIGTNYYQIGQINSDTSLDLTKVYVGMDITGGPYVAQVMLTGLMLQNFIVIGSTARGIYMRGVRHFVIENVSLQSNAENMFIEYCGDSGIHHVLSESSGGCGVYINNCASLSMKVIDIFNCVSDGVRVEGSTGSTSIMMSSCESSNNGGCGVSATGTVIDMNVSDCIMKYNVSRGFHAGSGATACMIDSLTVKGNGVGGVLVEGSNNVVTGITVHHNGGVGIEVGGMYCIVSGNNVYSCVSDGIRVTGSLCTVSGNTSHENGGDGLRAGGDNLILTGNISSNNTGYGVHIVLGTSNSIAGLNHLKGNTAGGLNDAGTSSSLVTNVIIA